MVREIKTGIDIVEISSVKALTTYQRRLTKVFTNNEINTAFKYNEYKRIWWLAQCFAVKEAFSKALGTGFTKDVQPNCIELLEDSEGKLSIKLYENTERYFKSINLTQCEVTASHSKCHAIAMVILI